MKKIFYTFLVGAITLSLASCSNGDYQADPASNANGAVNPVTPLADDEFNWKGEDPVSCDVNGTHWKADYASFVLDTSGANLIQAGKNGVIGRLSFYLKDVWKGNTYPMEWKDYNRYAAYYDSVDKTFTGFFSYLSNSGGLKIIQNDSAVIKGYFYFKGISPEGKIINVSNGWFNINKW